MSFLSNLFGGVINTGKKIFGAVTGNSVGSNILKTVLTGYAVRKLNESQQPSVSSSATSTSVRVDPGVRLQTPASQNNKVPVVYGSAQLSGTITDAVMSNSNTRMTYVFTICEKTGTKLSDGVASSFTFEDIYYNDQRIIFDADGITAAYSVDRDGNRDYSIDGLVKVYCYNGNSTSGVQPDNYTGGNVPHAYNVVPNWTSNHSMSDLIFAVVQVNYSREKGVTNLPIMRFHVTNSMTLPGDCLLDYMTNTRYGAGIPLSEIFDE